MKKILITLTFAFSSLFLSIPINANTSNSSYLTQLNNVEIYVVDESKSDEELLMMAENGQCYQSDAVSVSKDIKIIDDNAILETIKITRKAATKDIRMIDFSANDISLYATLKLEKNENLSYATVTSIINYTQISDVRPDVTGNFSKITSFSHSIKSYDYLFGRPSELDSLVTQTGLQTNIDGTKDTYETFTSSLTTTTPGSGRTYSKNTGFQYYVIESEMGYAEMETTMTFEHKDGHTTTHSFSFHL